MSVDVKYKGATIATVEAQETKTLTTAGKYCEADIVLTDDSNPIAKENDVIFIDYDGTIRYSYTAVEFLALTELPPNPTHKGLVAQGWNWTLEGAQDYVGKYGIQVIGQSYITESGTTEIDIRIPYDGFTFNVAYNQSRSNGSTIYWGDGSSQVVAATGDNTLSHEYVAAGEYTVSILPEEECVLKSKNSTNGTNLCTRYPVIRVRIGKNFTHFGWSIFSGFNNLKSITIPVGFLGTYWREIYNTFTNCYALRAIVFPPNTNLALDQNHAQNSGIEYISYSQLQSGAIGWRGVYQCYNLKSLAIPEIAETHSYGYFAAGCRALSRLSLGGVTTIYTNDFSTCSSLGKLVIPATVTTIQSSAFSGATAMYELRFAGETPPAITNVNAFSSLNSACLIYVPFHSIAAYLTATNYPAPATYTYVGFATYEDGETLPAQDSTEAYNVVWYASKADAVNEQNPITVGNGKEIYCRYTEVSA